MIYVLNLKTILIIILGLGGMFGGAAPPPTGSCHSLKSLQNLIIILNFFTNFGLIIYFRSYVI